MQFDQTFTVPAGIDDAWKVLLDIERIVPCLPGAAIDSVDGDDFAGTVKVKLGPIGLTYKGNATFTERDVAAHRVVIDASGRDTRGNGTAKATITASLNEAGGSTVVNVLTDLDITGKPAQFGRGVMLEVGNKLIGQFAECLAGKIAVGEAVDEQAVEASSGAEPAPAVTPRPFNPVRETEPINLIESAGPAVAKRLAPVLLLAVGLIAALIVWLRQRD